MKARLTSVVIYSLCFVLSFAQLKAQDIIIMRNGDEVQAKVEEVGQTEIKYKKFSNLEGPSYSVSKAQVFMIRYENGQRDVFEAPRPPANVQQAPSAPGGQPPGRISFTSSDIARARTAATIGYVAIAPVLGAAVGAAAADDGTAIGAAATVIFGVTLPIVAASGSKLRDKSGVLGSPGLRLAGWIGYGLTMADAIIAVGIGASELEVPDGTVIAIGVLGSASLAMIASEVMATANQSEALLSGKKISIGPTVGYYASRQGKYIPTIGVNIKFK